MDMVLVPVHLGMHWCLAVSNTTLDNKEIVKCIYFILRVILPFLPAPLLTVGINVTLLAHLRELGNENTA